MALDLAVAPATARGRWSANALPIGFFLIFAVLPLVALGTGGGYLVSLGARIMIFAVAAVALDLLAFALARLCAALELGLKALAPTMEHAGADAQLFGDFVDGL